MLKHVIVCFVLILGSFLFINVLIRKFRKDLTDSKPSEISENNLETDFLLVPMGVTPSCDTGKANLTVDWDGSPINYTCYGHRIRPDYKIYPHLYCMKNPKYYLAKHKCMRDTIEYSEGLPIYGNYRPNWGYYGEYKFIPRQRWLHNLEPFALLTWGCRLKMSYIDPELVQNFIRERALKAPEKVSINGEFVEGLLQKAEEVSDYFDSVICPKKFKI